MGDQIRVLIAEYDPMGRKLLTDWLQGAAPVEVVGTAATAEEVVVEAQRSRPDVVLMSETLPPKGGIELIERLREGGIDAAYFILVFELNREKLYQLARARVLGVAHRQLDLAYLVEMLVDVGQGRIRMDERTTQTWMDDYAALVEENVELRRRLVRYEPPFAALSDREVDVLRCIAAGLPNAEIADQLFISIHTVSKHVGEVRKKLQVGTRQEAANIAHKHGLCQ